MKIATGNFVVSCITACGWGVTLLLSLLNIQIIAMLTGLLFLVLFATNILGMLAGAVTLVTDDRSMLSWAGFGMHGIQFIVISGIILLGMIFG